MPQPNQYGKQRPDVNVTAKDLLDFKPSAPITESGVRNNISVGIQYLGSWLAGNGCVPVFNLMEDAATAEICRAQVWQWIEFGAQFDDGTIVSDKRVQEIIRHFHEAEKPIFTICHGVQVLIAVDGVVKGRRVAALQYCEPEVRLAAE